MTGVNESWDRIEKWFQDNGIADRLRPPTSTAEIEAAQAAVGLRFPADLVESLRRHDATVPNTCLIPPHWILLTLERVMEFWRCFTDDLAARQAAEIDDMSDEDDDDWTEVEEGEEDSFWGWNPAWLPIAADGGGGYLIVELRGGDRYGMVGRLDPEFPPPFGFDTWSSTSALLEHAATALETS